MDDRYPYTPNYPSRNDLINDFGSLASMDNLDSMSPYVYGPPSQYNPYHYVSPVGNPATTSTLYSHSPSVDCNAPGSGIGPVGGDLNSDSFYSNPASEHDPFSDEPPLMEELGINFDSFLQKSMLVGNQFPSNSNSKPESNLLRESDLGDLLTEKEDSSSTRSPISPTTTTSTTSSHTPSTEPPIDSNHHRLSSPETSNNYVDDRSPIYQPDTTPMSNHACDSLMASSNAHGNGAGASRGSEGNGPSEESGSVNRPESQENNQLVNSWEKPMTDELSYPFDSRLRNASRFSINPNLSHSLNPSHVMPKHPIGHQFVTGHPSPRPTSLGYNQHHRPLLPSLQSTAALAAYPYQRPVAIQPNLGYAHKLAPRFISPYQVVSDRNGIGFVWRPASNKMYTQSANVSNSSSHHLPPHMAPAFAPLPDGPVPSSSVHGRLPFMISSHMAFTNTPLGSAGDDSSSPSSSSTASSPPTPSTHVTMDKKLYMNNPLLVNMLTCPQIPGLRNLAPAPDSSSSHLDEKSKSEILSGLIDVSSEKRKRSHRAIATTSREPIKREMRPKIFDIEQFKIGMFHVQSSHDGPTRRNSSTQLKVIFSKRRFIYEFAFSGSYDKKDQPGLLSMPSSSTNFRCAITSNSCSASVSSANVNSAATSSISRIQSTASSNNPNSGPAVVYYVIAVPFETVTGLNIEDSTIYLTVDRVPALFGGTSVRSKVLFEKAPRFDPSQGEIESNALHCISLRSTQVGRLRSSLIEFDKKFAVLLSTKIDRDPFSYRSKLSESSRDPKEEEKSTVFLPDRPQVNPHNQLRQQQQPDSAQSVKKQKIINKVDYQEAESPSQSSNSLLDLS